MPLFYVEIAESYSHTYVIEAQDHDEAAEFAQEKLMRETDTGEFVGCDVTSVERVEEG